MKTYIYAEKNGNAALTLSAKHAREAENYLAFLVKNPREWRCDSVEVEE